MKIHVKTCVFYQNLSIRIFFFLTYFLKDILCRGGQNILVLLIICNSPSSQTPFTGLNSKWKNRKTGIFSESGRQRLLQILIFEPYIRVYNSLVFKTYSSDFYRKKIHSLVFVSASYVFRSLFFPINNWLPFKDLFVFLLFLHF